MSTVLREAYLAHADPRLSDVDEKAVLRPFPCALGLLCCQICAILLKVNLHDERNAASN